MCPKGAQVELDRERCVQKVLTLSCEVSECKSLPCTPRWWPSLRPTCRTASPCTTTKGPAADIARHVIDTHSEPSSLKTNGVLRRGNQYVPGTLPNTHLNPRSLSQIASYDTAGNICEALPEAPPGECRRCVAGARGRQRQRRGLVLFGGTAAGHAIVMLDRVTVSPTSPFGHVTESTTSTFGEHRKHNCNVWLGDRPPTSAFGQLTVSPTSRSTAASPQRPGGSLGRG